MHPEATANLLRSRRTIHLFRPDPPARELVDEAIALACWAPNHRLTEPWRFCWVGPETWQAIAELNAQLVSEKRGKDAAAAKLKRWLAVPGVVLVTCIRSEDPVRDEEDYAATACAVHNMALFLWSHGVGTKWSSGSVTRHPMFYRLFDIDPTIERVVGLIWYGYPDKVPATQRKPLEAVYRAVP